MGKNTSIQMYAESNYQKMFREPDGNLKYRYIVPGSMYSNSLWDWDCWLTNVALAQFVDEDISSYEKGCVMNFLEYVQEDGRIPITIFPTAMTPDFSRDSETNIHKPCLAQHAALIVKKYGNDAEWLRPQFHKLWCCVDC